MNAEDELAAARRELSDLRRAIGAREAELAEIRFASACNRAELDQIYAMTPDYVALFDRDLHYLKVNDALAEYHGVAQADHAGKTPDNMAPGMSAIANDLIRRVFETGQPERHQTLVGRIRDTQAAEQVLDVDFYPVTVGGDVVAVGVRAVNVTERRDNEVMVRHMIRELQHRVKNTLANVLALVEQARRAEGPVEDTLVTLQNRVTALAMTHGRLTESNWVSADLRELFEQELVGGDREPRVTLTGETATVAAQPSLALAMAIHELASNSRRYGALARDTGRLAVEWKVADGRLQIDWSETGGTTPSDLGAPGFGWRLIAASIRVTLKGSIEARVQEGGFRYSISMPASHVMLRRDGEAPI